MYRNICYQAAKAKGEDAAQNLSLIRDEELRLFAQIELAAALRGLPELRTMMQRMPRRET